MATLKKTIIMVVMALVLTTSTAYGATDAEMKAEVKLWKAYIEKLEAVLEQLRDRVDTLESQLDEPSPVAEKPKEYRFTVTVPEGSPVKQPEDNMTLDELRQFTANLFKKWQSPYNKFLYADEEELVEFLKSNGYKVNKDRI